MAETRNAASITEHETPKEVTEGRRVEPEEAPAAEEAASVLLQRDSEATPVLSIVMPTLNEEQGVAECIERAKRAIETLGVSAEIIISDSSTDRTPEIARELGAIVVEPDKRGYGYAYRFAFEHARGEYIVIGDADTTYDFEEFPRILELVAHGGADMGMGSRLAGTILPGAMPPLHQYVGNPLLTKFLNVFYGAGVSDAHSGFRVVSRDALDRLDLSSEGMEFASEMIMEGGAKGLAIEEVPITYHEREGEATLESFRDGWRHVEFMLTNAPGWLFSLPGAVLGTLGVLVMVLAAVNVTPGGTVFGIRSMVVGGLLTVLGHQVMHLGVFATVSGNPISRPNDRVTTWIADRMNVKHGATVGLGLLAVGGVYAAVLFAQWAAAGFVAVSLVETDVVAFTAIAVGIQTVFYSFFLEYCRSATFENERRETEEQRNVTAAATSVTRDPEGSE